MAPPASFWGSEEAELAALDCIYGQLDALEATALEQEKAQHAALVALEEEQQLIEEALRQLDVLDQQKADGPALVVGPVEPTVHYNLPLLRKADIQAMPLLLGHAALRRYTRNLLSAPPWSARDVEYLHAAVKNEQTRQSVMNQAADVLDWHHIAMSVPFHTADDCRTRWTFVEDPQLNQARWTAADKKELAVYMQKSGDASWEDAVQHMHPKRKGYHALEVHQRSTKPTIEWTPQRDQALMEAARDIGPDWKAVATRLGYPTMCATLCHRRHNKLKSSAVVMGRWSAEEDAALRAAVAQYGCDWKRVEICVQGRTGQQCRERWVGRLANIPEGVTQAVRRAWSKEEDDRLRACVHACKTWVQVAEYVGGRSDKMVRERWLLLKRREEEEERRQRGEIKTTPSRRQSSREKQLPT